MLQETAIERAESGIFGTGFGWLVSPFLAERERWMLWLPVVLGGGIGCYFLLKAEPPLWIGWAGLCGAFLLGLLLYRSLNGRLLALLLCAFALGFAAAQYRSQTVGTLFLERQIGPVSVEGQLVRIEQRPGDVRLTLEHPRIGRLPDEHTPRRVRAVVRGDMPDVSHGDLVRLRAVLRPPPGPSAPGGFDFQRHAYFEGIGGVGYAVGDVTRLAEGAPSGFWVGIDRLRRTVTARIRTALPGETGAMAAALLTGDRSGLPERALDTMRDSGLAHLLAISGLHMGLVAGTVFFVLRLLLACHSGLALNQPIKKWAALAALAASFVYLLLAGATVPTQRAFLMTGLVLVAVLIDRVAISLRLVAWAAAAILLLAPEVMLGPSFQMSFAAVLMLVAFYEANRERFAALRAGAGPLRLGLLYLVGLCATSVLATAGTLPFAAYHFNQVALYGVLANMAAVPLTAFWIMPWGVLALLLMPLGLEGLALVPMGLGIEGVLAVGAWISTLPGAVLAVPAMPAAGLLAISLGGLWLALWRRSWRFAGLAPVALGLALPWFTTQPVLLVDGEAKLVALRTVQGLAFSSARAASFTADAWLQRTAQPRRIAMPRAGSGGRDGIACDALGCIGGVGAFKIAIIRDAQALPEDCTSADIVVALVPVRRRCPSARLVVDRFDLWRNGAHALYLEAGTIRLDSVGRDRGIRPWAPDPAARRNREAQ
ncbi:ComEC/Rec2 family competence protein [Oceanibaculum nanhaiense]|uniref:ComEC/Rec2 family competence protein n=1 Tax=Oceanibaculum nanhaiense TaxID=1909734 RepID=UPI000A374B17|nr:ComEC/Rec2 family competence protein [Oceanibaculum nanhaiense]